MDPTTIITWADSLQHGGPWVLLVVENYVFGKVLLFLWTEIRDRDKRLFDVLDKTNELLKLYEQDKNERRQLPRGER